MTTPARGLAVMGRLTAVVAGALAVTGSLLPLFHTTLTAAGQEVVTEITGWSVTSTAQATAPVNGVPLVIAAFVLVVGAIARSGRSATIITVAGASLLTGAVLTVVMQEMSWSDSFQTATESMSGEGTIGIGLWLLLVADVLAIAASLLTMLASRPTPPPWPPAQLQPTAPGPGVGHPGPGQQIGY